MQSYLQIDEHLFLSWFFFVLFSCVTITITMTQLLLILFLTFIENFFFSISISNISLAAFITIDCYLPLSFSHKKVIIDGDIYSITFDYSYDQSLITIEMLLSNRRKGRVVRLKYL